MLHSRLLISNIGCVLAFALGVGCTGVTTGFEDDDDGPGNASDSGVNGGAAGNAGSMSPSGGTGNPTGGTTSGGQGGTSAGTGASGTSGTASGGASGSGVTGGSAGMGTAGMGMAGMGTAGMGTAGMGGMAPTTGCGAMTWPPGDGMALQTIDVDGTPREYIVQLPSTYDPSHPYRLVFAWHGRGGTAAQVARNFYGLESPLGATTIFVSGQGLGTAMEAGWPNTNGEDVAFVRALLASLSSSYCIDQNRIMSVGMSYGGIMSYHLGCQMSDVFRAIAPIAGAAFGGRGMACGTNPVAVWGAHGTADETVTYMSGESAKNAYVTRNGCQMTAQPVEPQPYCTQYDGCTAGYPVVWCVHDGGHTIPQWSGPAIATFFEQF